MPKHALPMTKANRERIEEQLKSAGFKVTPRETVNGGRTLRCATDRAVVLLSSHQPLEWSEVNDERKDLVVVAVVGASVYKFWVFKAQEQLCDQVIQALKPLAWTPKQK